MQDDDDEEETEDEEDENGNNIEEGKIIGNMIKKDKKNNEENIELSWKSLLRNFNWRYLEHHYFNPFLLRDYEKYDEESDEDYDVNYDDVISITSNDDYYKNNNIDTERDTEDTIGEKVKLLSEDDKE